MIYSLWLMLIKSWTEQMEAWWWTCFFLLFFFCLFRLILFRVLLHDQDRGCHINNGGACGSGNIGVCANRLDCGWKQNMFVVSWSTPECGSLMNRCKWWRELFPWSLLTEIVLGTLSPPQPMETHSTPCVLCQTVYCR